MTYADPSDALFRRIYDLEDRVRQLERRPSKVADGEYNDKGWREWSNPPSRVLVIDTLATSLQFDLQPLVKSLSVTTQYDGHRYVTQHVIGADLQRLKDFLS